MTAIILIRRQSPDWEALSCDYRRTRHIAPERYVPKEPVSGFPANLIECISCWNEAFAIDFFTFRYALARIAADHNGKSATVKHLYYWQTDEILRLADTPGLAFYHDDDDVFDVGRLSIQSFDAREADVLIFPLIHVHGNLFTLTPEGVAPDTLVGPAGKFRVRYHTNNYALATQLLSRSRVLKMKDHKDASVFADANNLVDLASTATVCATIKTPASASRLTRVLDPDQRAKEFRSFIANLSNPELTRVDWLRDTVARLRILLEAVIAGEPPEALEAAGILTAPGQETRVTSRSQPEISQHQ